MKTKNTKKLNRHIFIKDNLPVLRAFDDQSIDLIYLDPPFNSNKNYSAPIGSEAAGQHFKDIWTYSDTDDAWWGELSDKYPALYEIIHAVGCINGERDKSYLIAMAMRLLELHRVLKDTGSIYLHCDQTMSHSLKLVMDSIFGKKNFNNEISWRRGTGSSRTKTNRFPRNHDCLLFYSKTKDRNFKRQFKSYSEKTLKMYRFNDKDGRGEYRLQVLRTYGKQTIEKFKKDNRIKKSGTGKLYLKQYLNEKPGVAIDDVWENITGMGHKAAKEKTGYSTQKPLALLERIIKASSNKGDIVLDPFCGCATTCVAAEKLNRKWIGIDLSSLAGKLVKKRLKRQFEQRELGKDMIYPIIRDTLPIKDAPKPSKDIKHILYGKQRGICNGCNHHFMFKIFHIDHIMPTAKGGQDTDNNLQLLCGPCNSIKGDRDMAYLKARLKEQYEDSLKPNIKRVALKIKGHKGFIKK